jgi:hypothetical protein
MRKTIAIAISLFLLCVVAANAGTTGSIKGTVIDQAGNPVELANVFARDIEPSADGTVQVHMGAVPWVETDKQGKFLIRGLTVGHRYKLYTKKEEDGYADTSIPTYNPTDEGVVATASDSPRSSDDVKVQIGSKAVVFRYDLKDAVTGKELRDYTITVTRIDTDYSFSGIEGDNKVLLPADTDMSIKFEVKGYQPWYYPGHSAKEAAMPLRGSGGDERHVSVLMRPETATP